MRPFRTMLVAVALGGVLAIVGARADEDCDNVVSDLEEALAIATKNFDETMAGLKKLASEADDKKKASIKNAFCSASGELLGISRGLRAVAAVCGPKRRTALASMDKSIGEMDAAIDKTCN